MQIKKKLILIPLLILMFTLINNISKVLTPLSFYSALDDWYKYAIRYSLQIGLSFIFASLLLKMISPNLNLLKCLGLDKDVSKGLAVSFLFTLPMLIGYFLIAPFNYDTTFLDILFWAFVSSFTEELLFRGLLFGLLFRVFKVGFIPSIIFVSVLFALGHVYQGNDFNSVLGVTAITFIGSLIFGWLYIEWGENLWVPIGTHILMNLYWMVFDINATNALGGWGANIFRLLTIILLIVLTIRRVKREGSQIKGKWISLSY